jgi:prepilin-type N-terminal cleavage/methylation domain-containing protein
MLSQLRKRKKEQGFTIIEVMIVLAIAGLILLIVFLAVPALQRNARNTQRREDAGNILSAVSEYESNNNGATPGAQASLATTGSPASSATLGTGTGINTVPINLGYYDAAKLKVVDQATYGTSNATTTDTAAIVTGASCNGNDPQSASSRSVVVLYTIESSAKQCRQS